MRHFMGNVVFVCGEDCFLGCVPNALVQMAINSMGPHLFRWQRARPACPYYKGAVS